MKDEFIIEFEPDFEIEPEEEKLEYDYKICDDIQIVDNSDEFTEYSSKL